MLLYTTNELFLVDTDSNLFTLLLGLLPPQHRNEPLFSLIKKLFSPQTKRKKKSRLKENQNEFSPLPSDPFNFQDMLLLNNFMESYSEKE